jgi:hypothetical protein
LALTSSTRGGLLVGIVPSQTQATECSFSLDINNLNQSNSFYWSRYLLLLT